MGETIDTSIEKEMQTSYIDYAMSVIVGRALPDARDGLKPAQRRVLYAMYRLGNLHSSATKKLESWLTFDTENGYPSQGLNQQNCSFEIVVL